jgi:diguanylate cyclase (GGDEF)-like protein
MIDIDHFKKVNDTYGHQAGDQVLHSVAQTILREVVPDGIACRYGGEEIAVFFPKKEAKEVAKVMEEVRAAIERTKVATRKKKLSVTVSIGVSHRGDVSQTIIDVIHAADKALYRAKGNGRNQVKTGKAPMPKTKKK